MKGKQVSNENVMNDRECKFVAVRSVALTTEAQSLHFSSVLNGAEKCGANDAAVFIWQKREQKAIFLDTVFHCYHDIAKPSSP